MRIRFFIEPETGRPHVEEHGVTEREVEEALTRPVEDRPGEEGSRIAIGRTKEGRILRVIYVPDPEPERVFVITAYPVTGKMLHALQRRIKRRRGL